MAVPQPGSARNRAEGARLRLHLVKCEDLDPRVGHVSWPTPADVAPYAAMSIVVGVQLGIAQLSRLGQMIAHASVAGD